MRVKRKLMLFNVVVVTSLFDAKNDNKSLKPVASKSTRTALVVALSLVVTNTCAAFAEELFFFILSSLRAFLGKMFFLWRKKKSAALCFLSRKTNDGEAGKSLSNNNNSNNKTRFDSSFRVVRFGFLLFALLCFALCVLGVGA